MKLRSVLALFVAVLTVASQVAAQCKLTSEQIEPEKRIFAIKPGTKLQLLRRDVVETSSKLHMICDENDTSNISCKLYGSGKNAKAGLTRKLPINKCDRPLKPIVKKVKDKACKNAELYKVGYEMNGNFMELYRSCYKSSEVKAKYVKHNVYYHTAVTKRPTKMDFTLDKIIKAADAATYKAEQIYLRFRQLLGNDQKYILGPWDEVFDRGHLAPSADFLFIDGKKATFKFINVIPQFNSINHGNWKTIESWVRKRLTSKCDGTTIVTGALDPVLSLRNKKCKLVPIYLAKRRKNPVPKWIYKFIADKNRRFVFVTYNNVYDNKCPVPICKRKNCPIELSDEKEKGLTYCCDPSQFKRKYLPGLTL